MVERVDDEWVRTDLLNFRAIKRRGSATKNYIVFTRSNGRKLGTISWKVPGGYVLDLYTPSLTKEMNRYESDIMLFYLWALREHYRVRPKKVPSFKERRQRRLRSLLSRPNGGGLDKRYAPVVQ